MSGTRLFPTRPVRPVAMARIFLACAIVAVLSVGFTAPQANGTEADPKHCRKFSRLGLPLYRGDFEKGHHQRICRPGYALSHNNVTKEPDWVAELLIRDDLKGTADREKSRFRPEPEVSPGQRAELKDYRKSNFDRGHQAPAADFKRKQSLMDDSFYLSNMAPQVGPGFNRGIWARLEERVRELVRSRKRLYVFTGPIYDAPELQGPDTEFIGKNKVAVPDGFFKILYDSRRGRALAFILPNRKLPKRRIGEFRATVREVEELTGLNFFPRLSRRRQNILEIHEGEMWRW